jgi:hypothetical protein
MLQQKTLPYGTPFEVGTLCTAYKHLLSDETPRAASVQIHTAAACWSTDSLPRTILNASWFSGSGTSRTYHRFFFFEIKLIIDLIALIDAHFAKEFCSLLANLKTASPRFGKDIDYVLVGKDSMDMIKKVKNSLKRIQMCF